MKGIVYNLLEEAVVERHGVDLWEELLERTNLEGAYTSLGSYDDEEFLALLATASDQLFVSVADLLLWFGEYAMGGFVERYPEFFVPHERTIPFLLTLNEIIHPEVRKLYPGADVPNFEFERPDQDAIIIHYSSPKRLCHFAIGLIRGAARHFGEAVEIHEDTCMHRGDPSCALVCTFPRAAVGDDGSASSGRGDTETDVDAEHARERDA